MALDGIVIAALVQELRRTLLGGHIQKIAMPENNELLLTIKNNASQHRLLISCEAALPLLYLQRENKPSPLTAPGFAMLLRKHIGSGKITAIEQLGLERIVRIETTQLNELGDIAPRALYVELMGKYSNIIFTDENNVILDSMRRVPASVSSLREVLPGRPYFVPEKLKKPIRSRSRKRLLPPPSPRRAAFRWTAPSRLPSPASLRSQPRISCTALRLTRAPGFPICSPKKRCGSLRLLTASSKKFAADSFLPSCISGMNFPSNLPRCRSQRLKPKGSLRAPMTR